MSDKTSEVFNQFIRPFVTAMLTVGFVYGFVGPKLIGADIYANTFAVVIGFWFGTRTAEKRASDATPPGTTAPAAQPADTATPKGGLVR